MRQKVVAGNWKMMTNFKEGIELATEVNKLVLEKANPDVNVILSPPFTHLSAIKNIVNGSRIKLSAQNCAATSNGAYTGEISAEILNSVGIDYVIIGHSERRDYYHEDNASLTLKIKQAIANNLKPIYCIGEHLIDREAGNHFNVIREHLEEVLFEIPDEDFQSVIIAYEPVWAIGTGVSAQPEDVQEMHVYIRDVIDERFDFIAAENLTILYGGSIKPNNAKELFANKDVDGGLIGGASLKATDFLTIMNSF